MYTYKICFINFQYLILSFLSVIKSFYERVCLLAAALKKEKVMTNFHLNTSCHVSSHILLNIDLCTILIY